MATVRMSNKLIDKMVSAAGQKFAKQNPEKAYPVDSADAIAAEFNLIEKATLTKEFVDETWLGESSIKADYNYQNINTIDICATIETYDENGNIDSQGNYDIGGNYISSYDKEKSYSLELTSPIEMPECVAVGYKSIKISVNNDHPTFVACAEIDAHNSKVRNELYEFKNKLRETFGKFTTLNQALKASKNKYSALVPEDIMQRVMEKDNRKKKDQELANIASEDMDTLSEVLLTDSLLGDDS